MRERIQENVQRLEGAKAARDTRSFGSAGPEGRGGQGVWPSEPQGASSAGNALPGRARIRLVRMQNKTQTLRPGPRRRHPSWGPSWRPALRSANLQAPSRACGWGPLLLVTHSHNRRWTQGVPASPATRGEAPPRRVPMGVICLFSSVT